MEMNPVEPMQDCYLLIILLLVKLLKHLKMLDELVILFDPSFNPDGYNAFHIGQIQIKIKTLPQIQMIENTMKFGHEEEQIIIGLI